jgi:hypothetical protein
MVHQPYKGHERYFSLEKCSFKLLFKRRNDEKLIIILGCFKGHFKLQPLIKQDDEF